MALGLKQGSGDFLPIVKYDARSGKTFRVDRVQDANGNYQATPVELEKPAFLVDLYHVEVGWIGFPDGKPDLHLVALGQDLPPRPSKDHKDGFRVLIKLPEQVAGGHAIRHFSHASSCVVKAFDGLHDVFLAAPEAKQGLIPLVQIVGTDMVTGRTPSGSTSTNYAPRFQIVRWLPRPADLDPEKIAKEAGAAVDEPHEDSATDLDAIFPLNGSAAPANGNGNGQGKPAAAPVAVAAPVEELRF